MTSHQLLPLHTRNNYHGFSDLPGYWNDYDFKIGYLNVPGRDGYALLGKNSVYPAEFWPTLTPNFEDNLFRLQRTAQSAHYNSQLKYIPASPKPMKRHQNLATLMLSQLNCVKHNPDALEHLKRH